MSIHFALLGRPFEPLGRLLQVALGAEILDDDRHGLVASGDWRAAAGSPEEDVFDQRRDRQSDEYEKDNGTDSHDPHHALTHHAFARHARAFGLHRHLLLRLRQGGPGGAQQRCRPQANPPQQFSGHWFAPL